MGLAVFISIANFGCDLSSYNMVNCQYNSESFRSLKVNTFNLKLLRIVVWHLLKQEKH